MARARNIKPNDDLNLDLMGSCSKMYVVCAMQIFKCPAILTDSR
jgi:hypothetical protein